MRLELHVTVINVKLYRWKHSYNFTVLSMTTS